MIPMPVFELIAMILSLYQFIIIAMVVMSWLIGFNVINRHNQIVDMIWRTLVALTEPLLGPIRRALPNMGGLDLSPLVLLFGIIFLSQMIGGSDSWIGRRIGVS